MIYILVDDIVKAKFFLAFSKSSEVIFITNKLSCYLFFKLKCKSKVIFLKAKDNNQSNSSLVTSKLEKTIAVLNRRQSLDSAIKNYYQVYSSIDCQIGSAINFNDIIILFNGNHASAMAAADLFKRQNAKTLYAEISNLPGKMIFDPMGVNAQSILYSKPQILDQFSDIAESKHNDWLESYIEYKKKPIPQSKINFFNYTLIAFDDFIARMFSFAIKEDSLSFKKKLTMFSDKFKSKKMLSNKFIAELDCKYIFFPTQVTSDTQLKINSQIDNIGAINHILQVEKDKTVYVKIHPAESDINTIDYFLSLSQSGKIKLVSNDTVDLIRHADLIYTINSTVGLEAFIFQKDLIVLGNAIYSNFDFERLKKYIHCYLMDFDYFGANKLSDYHFAKLVDLSEYKS